MKDIITKFGIPEVQPVDEANNNDLQGNVVAILNAVIGVLSFVCVVVIIIGGVTYMTSSGDTSKVKKSQRHHPLWRYRSRCLCACLCYCQLRHFQHSWSIDSAFKQIPPLKGGIFHPSKMLL